MISIQNITKIFHSGQSDVIALDKVNIEIPKGEFALIKGPSGCGKSTLLFTLGGMLKPSSGEVLFKGRDLYQLSAKELLHYRARQMGFVYQSYHLIPYLSILENVLLVNQADKKIVTKKQVIALAERFHLTERLFHKPAELSVGECQRAALMRALVIKPELLIADEPTGNLDPENSQIIMRHFKAFQEDGGTIVMASHDDEADDLATLQVNMRNGEIV